MPPLALVKEPPAQAPSASARVGRPRNEELDALILHAVREALVDRGYGGLTIQDVTRRCGVNVRTITRRWSTKPELVAAAVLGPSHGPDATGELPVPAPTGDLRRDVRRLIEATLSYLAEPASRAALPALWGETLTNPRIRELLDERDREWAAAVEAVVREAVKSGTAPPGAVGRAAPLPRILAGISMGIGSMDGVAPDSGIVDEVTDFVVGALVADGS